MVLIVFAIVASVEKRAGPGYIDLPSGLEGKCLMACFSTACGFDKEVAPGLLTGQLNYIPLNGRTRANAN